MKKFFAVTIKVFLPIITFLIGLVVGGCVVANDYYNDTEDYEYENEDEDEVLSI